MPPGQPPYGPPPGADYAAFGGGQGPKPRNTKKWLIGGGSVVAAAALIGGGAFAAASLLGGDGAGDQPAEALPNTTFAYASVDLSDLNDAFQMLAKFPAVTKDADLGSLTKGGGDPREKIVKAILDDEDGDFCGGLTWEKDFAPWLGQKAAVAGVDVDDSPRPVVVVQVKDADAAQKAFDKFNGCDDSSDDAAYSISGDWALLGQDQKAVNEIAKEAGSSSLADDKDYKNWTGQIGDQGVMTLYASPKAGELIGKAIKKYPSMLGDLTGQGGIPSSPSGDDSGWAAGPEDQGDGGVPSSPENLLNSCSGLFSSASGAADYYEKAFANFGGGAATVRFSDGGVELESAVDSGKTSSASDDAAGLVTSLPSDTAAAVGVSVGDHPVESALDSLAAICGSGFDVSSLEKQISQMTGLDFPTDLDTLLGDGVAVSVGGDFDPSAINNPADLPAAIKVKGDPDEIEKVVGKISDSLGGASGVLGTDKDGDDIAIGPNATYRKAVLGDGGLEGDKTFKNVVPHADKSSVIVYVNFNDFDKLVGSGEDAENFKVLDGLGISAWTDGTTQHAFARLSTD